MKLLSLLLFIALSLAVGAMARYWGTIQTVPEIMPRFGWMLQMVAFFAAVFLAYIGLIVAGWFIAHVALSR